MDRHEPFVLDHTIPGVRVASPASGESVSPIYIHDTPPPRAKHYEAWATAGLGLVQSRNRYNRLKRSYIRACFRSLDNGLAMYRNKALYPAQVPFRIRQLWAQRRRQIPCPRVSNPTPPASGHLQVLQWNALRSLHYPSWLAWCDRSPYDIIIAQEMGWGMTSEWSTPQWHVLHGADRYASVLVMVRAALISREAISVAHHIPGRIMQVKLQLYRPHDIYAIYQHAWNSGGNVSQLLNKRQRIWDCLRTCINHTPTRNLLVLGGDYNTPLDFDGQHIFTKDPKYAKAAQIDRDNRLAAIHTRVFHPTFVHGDHNTRIDFVLMRKDQISWSRLQPKHHPDFDFLFGNQGPRHYPLSFHLSKWYPTPNPKHHEGINRFRLRQAWTQQNPQWNTFLTQARHAIATTTLQSSPIDSNLALERSLVQLCK